MKKSLLTVFFLLGLINIFASSPTIIYGTWERGTKKRDTEVKLYRVLSGRLSEIATSRISENNHFGFAFEPQDDGIYVIGSGPATSAQNKYIFYFKPGDRLDIAVNDSNYVLTGKNSPENTAIAQWHNEVSPLEYKAVYPTSRSGFAYGQPSTYVDFFPLLSSHAEKEKNQKFNIGNKQFEGIFKKIRNFDLLRYAYTFVLTPRTVHPDKLDFPDFYTNLKMEQLTRTTDLLHYPFGIQLMRNILTVQDMSGINNNTKPAIEEIKNDTLKGELAITIAEKLKTYTDLQQFNTEYGKYILTEDQKERINTLASKLTQNDPNLNTIDFSGTDVTGKKISISDFKGKVVVVDVWATWCGPCRREIPALKALEKEYHDKNVVFLSISLDKAKDKQKWIDFIKKEELTGVQLFGGNGLSSDVAKLYHIKGIPRFMVFAKDGNIVTDDAPRPSNASLKNMIEEQLNK